MFILKFFKGMIKKVLVTKKEEIITFLNKKIDLPKLDEKEERKLLNNIYEVLIMLVDKIL